MVFLAFVVICFMVIVWRRLDKFESEIEVFTSNNQTDSEILVDNLEDNTEKIPDKNSDDILEQDTTGSVNADNDVAIDKEQLFQM